MVGESGRNAGPVATAAPVTSWGPQAVAKYAEGAGFKGDALHDAVALAMAATQGADHYRHNPAMVPGAERRGLWAIRLDEVPAARVVDLFKPEHAAAIARELWAAAGESFGWHPTWISGHAAHVRPLVVASLTGRGVKRGPVSALPFSDQLAHAVSRANAFGQVLDTGQAFGA